MKAIISTLVLSFTLSFVFGQSLSKQIQLDPTLLKVKIELENHFSGSKIRSIREDFNIEIDNHSNLYRFKSDINKMRTESQQEKLNAKLNKLLKEKHKIKLEGQVYFETHLDSALVNVKYSTPDTIYEFISLPSNPYPRKGYITFSKDLHNEIKAKIKNGEISKDSILSLNHIAIVVGRGKTVIAKHQDFLVKPLDSFLKANRWTNSGNFYLEAKAEIFLQHDYLTDKLPWFGEPINDVRHFGYGGRCIRLKLITPYSIGLQTTFFSEMPIERYPKITASISLVYDRFLNKYRMPVIHYGNIEETNKLIKNVMDSSNRQPLWYSYQRIYFYREE